MVPRQILYRAAFWKLCLEEATASPFTRLDHNRTVVSECFVEQGWLLELSSVYRARFYKGVVKEVILMAMVSFEECPQGVVSVSGTVLFRGWSEYAA